MPGYQNFSGNLAQRRGPRRPQNNGPAPKKDGQAPVVVVNTTPAAPKASSQKGPATPKKSGRQNRPGSRKNGDPFAEISTVVQASLRRPTVGLLCVLACAFIVAHKDGIGPVHTICNASTSPVCTWAKGNTEKIFGLAIFGVAAWDTPRRLTFQVFAASVAWVLLVPEPGVWAYAVQALLLHTYLWVQGDTTKVLVLGLGCLAYFLGYIPVKV